MSKPKVVAFTPIKLNSERLANKNILELGGKPLCWHLLNTLTKCESIDEVYVYCSDEAIQDHVPPGVNFLQRDSALDGNRVKGMEIYTSFVNEIDADLYVLAHVTSPFTKAESVDNAVRQVLSGDYDSALSVMEVKTFCWFKGQPLNYEITDPPRTQELEPVTVETSAFFIFSKQLILHDHRRIGHRPWLHVVDSTEAIDIDEREDFELANKIIEHS